MRSPGNNPLPLATPPVLRCVFTLLFCTLLPIKAITQETGRTLDDLDPLRFVPLPGEGSQMQMNDRQSIEQLTGRIITKVDALDPPAGFDPVTDANIPLGIKLSPSLVRRAIHTLWESGKYRDIKISAQPDKEHGVSLFIEVAPMLRLVKLKLEGNKAMDDDQIARVIGYAAGQTILPDPSVLRAQRAKLVTAYAQYGYEQADASLRLITTENPGNVELSVSIAEGPPERYTRIQIPNLPKDVPISVFGIKEGMVRNREEVKEAVEELLEHLAEFGYADAEVLPFRETPLGDHKVDLTIPLNPGLPSQVFFRGNTYFLSKELKELIHKNGGMRTSSEAISRQLTALTNHYKKAGFYFVKIEATRNCMSQASDRTNTIQSLSQPCGKNVKKQLIQISIEEGPHVEVTKVLFAGNTWFSNQELEDELFAFISEKNKSQTTLQPLTTATIDDLGLSDKRNDGAVETTGRKAPQYRRSRVYLTHQYLEGMEHLVGVYKEKGFLAAKVRDTCRFSESYKTRYRGMTFTPLTVIRQSEEENETQIKDEHPCVLINQDRKHLLVNVTVEEGVQTTLHEIKYKGNYVISSKDLQKISQLSVTSPYNEYVLRESARRIKKSYQDKGHMFVEVTWERFFSEDMNRARVIFQVDEGPPVRLGQIRIEGTETTSNQLIRERLTLEPGDLITPDDLEESQMKLMELGVFNGATVQIVAPETHGETKNIIIKVTESKPQYLELRWGIATVEGIRTGLEYGFNNIAGWAINARFRARANYRVFFIGNPDFEQRYREMDLTQRLEHHVLLGIGSPHLPGTKGILGWGLDFIKERLNKPGFSADRFTGFLRLSSTVGLGLDYPHGLVWEARTGIEYNIEIEPGISNNPFLRQYLRLPQGASAFYVLGLNFALDLRDSPFSPTQGFFLSIGGDWVKSLPIGDGEEYIPGSATPIEDESNLLRIQATASGYISIFKTDWVLALSITGGYIFHLIEDSTTWPDRYFYVGGVDTLRGFPEDDLMPEDIYEEWKKSLNTYSDDVDDLLDSRGGQVMAIARLELRYPLAKGFYGAGFFEVGNVWREQDSFHLFSYDPFDIHVRPVAGLGIRYQTPIGPVSFDWGVNLDRRPHELPFSWYFSIGTAF